MSRIEKGSRLRGLPPFIRLNEIENVTGSLPTKSRTSCDNRRGNYSIYFDDQCVVETVPQNTHNYDPKLNDSLVIWWRFEEINTSGQITKNLASSKHNGFLSGSVSIVLGQIPNISYDRYPTNNGLAFFNIGSFIFDENVEYYNELDLGNNTSFSFGGWFKSVNNSIPQPLFYKGDDNKPEAYLMLSDTDKIIFYIGTAGDPIYKTYISTNSIDPLSWNHIIVTFSPNIQNPNNPNVKLYVNGNELTLLNYINNGVWTSFTSTNSTFVLNKITDLGFLNSNFSISTIFGNKNVYKDVVFFKKELSSQEISELYYSNEKKYGGLNVGTGLPSSSHYLNSEIRTGINITSASLKFGNGDKWIIKIPGKGQDLQPFNDSGHPALDGMREASISESNGSFYLTGSDLSVTGPGFQQSLWHKTKIEIDLTPSANHGFGLINFSSGSSYAMAYFNKKTRLWTGVGSPLEPINYAGLTPDQADTSVNSLLRFLDEKAVGFGIGLSDGIPLPLVSASYLFGNPIDNFGFPYHPKYSGSYDTKFSLKDYISEPFLLEKVVLYTSASFKLRSTYSIISLATFFILNETRISQKIKDKIFNSHTLYYMSGTIENTYTKNNITYIDTYSFISSSLITDTQPYSVRDLVTWIQFAGINSNLMTIDQNYKSFCENFIKHREKIVDVEWEGQFVASGTVKSPLSYSKGIEIGLNYSWPNNTNNNNLFACSYREQWSFNGRSGFETRFISKRDWKNILEIPIIYTKCEPYSYRDIQYELYVNEKYSKENPYILFPTDELIFGWNISGPDIWNYNKFGVAFINQNGGPYLSFSELGIHKVVLYGSLLRVGENGNLQEYHDTLNQHLTSISIHETIG
jgi:hypothetical protein